MNTLPSHLDWLGPREALLTVSPQSPFFDGHFPGLPILPGAVILEMSREFLLSLPADPETPSSTIPAKGHASDFHVHKAKFSGAVRPQTALKVTAEYSGKNWEVRWVEAGSGKEVVALSVSFGRGI